MSSKVIIVTGASRGIGLAVVKILLDSKGANVVAASRTITPELQSLADAHPNSLKVVQGDLANASVSLQTVSEAISAFERLDGIVFNAGILEPLGRIASKDISVDSWKSLFDINFFAVVQMLKDGIPYLRERKGKVVLVSSGLANGKLASAAPYSASKAALNSLARTLANEEKEITSIALRPGVVDTGMQTALRNEGPGKAAMLEHELTRFFDLHATGKLLKPEQPAEVIAGLVLHAPHELSGRFVSWDSDDLEPFRTSL
ncbi:short-chain dehydrogenase [Cantharellus anzutake]|uniref:short-chain dehydrogenase n=1 Tax=Cantharellus anzutake TaxID=1750568 RepID=UPI001907F57F|nr:short-chain dehydrogenase [Cantharellus anzutake]KAF8338830.1 short-chain dehydrogenase [Cantharellus anzutake]